jgi:hypothetical protein
MNLNIKNINYYNNKKSKDNFSYLDYIKLNRINKSILTKYQTKFISN